MFINTNRAIRSRAQKIVGQNNLNQAVDTSREDTFQRWQEGWAQSNHGRLGITKIHVETNFIFVKCFEVTIIFIGWRKQTVRHEKTIS